MYKGEIKINTRRPWTEYGEYDDSLILSAAFAILSLELRVVRLGFGLNKI